MRSARRDIKAGRGSVSDAGNVTLDDTLNGIVDTPADSPTDYRLKRRKLIGRLFSRSNDGISARKTTVSGPVRLSYEMVNRPIGISAEYQAGVTTNRRISRAVDRNRIKRILRDAVSVRHVDLRGLPVPEDKLLIFMLMFRSSTMEDTTGCHDAAADALATMIEDFKHIQSADGTT